MNILTSLEIGYKKLKKIHSSYKIDSEILLSKTLNISREEMLLNLNKKIDQESQIRYLNFIEQRVKRVPVAYITKDKEFWKNKFAIDKNVLVPRPDTEILVDEILKLLKKNDSKCLLDIGVGSGCISISILKERKLCKFIAIDTSGNALKVAKFNAKLHQLSNRIKFFKRGVDNFYYGKYDLVVSNPPYISKHKIKYLGDVIHEPKIALDGGCDGLETIKKVISRSKYLLKNNGKLVLEIGFNQKYKVIEFLKKKNFLINRIIKDYGNNVRCIISTKIK
ncbi:peptide chain release factor N(5)-glutamine methyltransferase [Candidatus Pelagibacter communis]|uniref:peptide chain release factor N(5)-glutamine methyltransferase n=1 Tax=Pelagibacter ubique TaxID=198252 RepID=UPI00094C45F7|nr:peptide chain release factor N(5)-glutamine methyltransferase [Candidatus Pelagibacter ubique]